MAIDYEAAWAADGAGDWQAGVDQAIAWVDAQSARAGAPAILVTAGVDDIQYIPALWEFVDRHQGQHLTVRRAQRSRDAMTGPVLAYFPDAVDLELAMARAKGTALAVVESPNLKVRGWARETNAVDLFSPDTLAQPIDSAFAKAVEALLFCGNNGYADQPGKRDAQRILTEFHRQPGIEDLPSAVLAHGISPKAHDRLKKMIEDLAPR